MLDGLAGTRGGERYSILALPGLVEQLSPS
jgi:hypothetical protein